MASVMVFYCFCRPLAPLLAATWDYADPRGLDPSAWTLINDLNGAVVSKTAVTDNDPATVITLQQNGTVPPGMIIDLGTNMVVNRVFVTGADRTRHLWNEPNSPARGMIRVYVGASPTAMSRTAEFMVPYDVGAIADLEADLRFTPAAGRYVKIELQTDINWLPYGFAWPAAPVPDMRWRVGEVEVHGFAGAGAAQNDAVVVPAGTAKPLSLAALELSYYLGKLTGKPYPIITEAQTNQYPGRLYRVMDLKPLAPDYSTMKANEVNGKLPTNLNVEVIGREVRFRSWPYRSVLQSVWAFLEYQGVRWVSPDAHGEDVPANGSVNLDLSGMRTTCSAKAIYANWEADSFEPWPEWVNQTIRPDYLYVWRNGWTTAWNDPSVLGGAEVPQRPPNGSIPPQYLDEWGNTGFENYPHNLSSVVPASWWQTDANGNSVLDMTDRNLIEWVAAKMIAVESANPVDHDVIRHYCQVYNLLPMDSAVFCQSVASQALNSPADVNAISYTGTQRSESGAYYYFINEIAKLVKQLRPDLNIVVGALAYADVCLPPPTNQYFVPGFHFESNVRVEVCRYGSENLPMDAPANDAMRADFERWRSMVDHLTTYDYTLLHVDYWQPDPQLPVAAVSGIVGTAKYLEGLGALNGGTQASPSSIPYNPWNFYAYPKIRQNTSLAAAQIVEDFFNGYFREAGSAMLAYYDTLESYQVRNNADMHWLGYCYGLRPGTFPIGILAQMKSHLEAAELAAQSWVVRERVAKIREGFDYVIARRGLQGVDLSATSGYQAVGQTVNAPVHVDLAKAVTPDQGPWGNYGTVRTVGNSTQWDFISQGAVYKPVYFVQGGTYEFAVRAWSTDDPANMRTMTLFAGAHQIASVPVQAGTAIYTFTADIPEDFGVQDVLVRTLPYSVVSVLDITVTLKSQRASAPVVALAGQIPALTNQRVLTVNYTVDGVLATPATFALVEGANSGLMLTAMGADGQQATYDLPVVTLDTAAPVIVVTKQIPAVTDQPVLTVYYTADGVSGTASFSLKGGENAGLTITATDAAGNQAVYALPTVKLASNQPPVVSAITTPSSDIDAAKVGLQVYATGNVTLHGSATDPEGSLIGWQWIYRCNGGAEVLFLSGVGGVSNAIFDATGKSAATYEWMLRVSDGVFTQESGIVTEIVNSAPVAAAQTLSFNQDTQQSITLTATDVNKDALTYAIAVAPAHGTLARDPAYPSDARRYVYKPAAGYRGTDAFSFKANDGRVDSAAAAVSLTVWAVNHAPVITAVASRKVKVGVETRILVVASDPDGDRVALSLVSPPSGARIVGSYFVWTPAASQIGREYSITVKASDGLAATQSTFKLAVIAR